MGVWTRSGVLLAAGMLAFCGLAFCGLAFCGLALFAGERVDLAGGGSAEVLTLNSPLLSVGAVPELGGKIISLRDAAGREYVSRSSKPYQPRKTTMSFGDTEFDGMDEIFPDMKGGGLAVGTASFPVPDHGWLFGRGWSVARLEANFLTLRADCAPAPVLFERTMLVTGDVLQLRYRVENHGEVPLPYLYAFHPLFSGGDGVRLVLPPGQNPPVVVSWSTKGFLGKNGTQTDWQTLLGGALEGGTYRAGSKRYYKYFVRGIGQAALAYPGGARIELEWPAQTLPYLALWCSEGGVGDLEHIAPEPTTTRFDSLSEAVRGGEARTLAAGAVDEWTIRLRVAASAGPLQTGMK